MNTCNNSMTGFLSEAVRVLALLSQEDDKPCIPPPLEDYKEPIELIPPPGYEDKKMSPSYASIVQSLQSPLPPPSVVISGESAPSQPNSKNTEAGGEQTICSPLSQSPLLPSPPRPIAVIPPTRNHLPLLPSSSWSLSVGSGNSWMTDPTAGYLIWDMDKKCEESDNLPREKEQVSKANSSPAKLSISSESSSGVGSSIGQGDQSSTPSTSKRNSVTTEEEETFFGESQQTIIQQSGESAIRDKNSDMLPISGSQGSFFPNGYSLVTPISVAPQLNPLARPFSSASPTPGLIELRRPPLIPHHQLSAPPAASLVNTPSSGAGGANGWPGIGYWSGVSTPSPYGGSNGSLTGCGGGSAAGNGSSYFSSFDNNNNQYQQQVGKWGNLRQTGNIDPAIFTLDARTDLPVEVLEEKFKDFKLKPKALTDRQKAMNGEPTSYDGGRKSRYRNRRPSCVECAFCRNNGEDEVIYKSHVLKNPDGEVVCPVLRLYNCPICNNGGGPKAHTIRYCPKNRPGITGRGGLYRALAMSGNGGMMN